MQIATYPARLFLVLVLAGAPALAQDSGRGARPGLFDGTERPSQAARRHGLEEPYRPSLTPHLPGPAPVTEGKPDPAIEFGIEGSIWVGAVMKL